MYCEMNMETGKYEMIRYERGDLLIEKNAPTERFVLIVKVKKLPNPRWCPRRYFLFDENRPRVIYDATKEDLKVLFKPYRKPTDFYK